MKCCKACLLHLDTNLFPTRKRSKDGFDSYCKSCNAQKSKDWNKQNRDRRREINKKYAIANRDKVLNDMRAWYKRNSTACKKNIARRTKEREDADINFKLARRLRARMCSALRRHYKAGSAVKELGCSIEYFKKHLESQFEPGMTWDNYGKWEIDHIIPLASVNLSDIKAFLQVAHYSNMRPLWKIDNLRRRFYGKDKK